MLLSSPRLVLTAEMLSLLLSLVVLGRCGAFTNIASRRETIANQHIIAMRAIFSANRRSFVGSSIAATTLFTPPRLPKSALAADILPKGGSPKIVLWGYGNQNKLMAKYLHERKYPVVAVVAHKNIGEDYGMVESDWGNIGTQTGVIIISEDEAPTTLETLKADVCIMCTCSTIQDLQPALTVCANAKVNVITIAEELLNSWTSSPKITKEMDALFKSNGVSLTGSGFIDGACCEMALTMSSMMHRMDALEGSLQYNVDDYGKVLAIAHGVGLTKAQFQRDIIQKPQAKSYVYNTNEWFVSAFGLTLLKTTEVREPTFSKNELQSVALKKTIPAGDCTGMKVIATTTTKEGICFVAEQIGKCYDEGDEDFCSWGFLGEPSGVRFTIQSPPTPQMTNTATISRISQIIAAEPGYVTTDRLAIARYEHFSSA